MAVPAFKKAFDDAYPDAKKVSDEQKCNLCHFGKSKKNKNDYGKALAELLKKDNYKDERVKAEADKVKAEKDALEKRMAEFEEKQLAKEVNERISAARRQIKQDYGLTDEQVTEVEKLRS